MDESISYDAFDKAIKAAISQGCTDNLFCQLSMDAVAIYKMRPDLGEKTAERMSDVWARYHDQWAKALADDLGQLFADLDLPPHHVAGGERGACEKWRQIEALTSSVRDRQPG